MFGCCAKTLSGDYSKNLESVRNVLCQMISGQNFELIHSAAAVTGKLPMLAAEIIRSVKLCYSPVCQCQQIAVCTDLGCARVVSSNCPVYIGQGLYAHPLLISYLFRDITYHLDPVLSASQPHGSGTNSVSAFVKPSHFLLLNAILRLTFSSQLTRPPSDPPSNAPLFLNRLCTYLLTYL